MSTDKNLDEVVVEAKEAFENFSKSVVEIKKVNNKAKCQRQKMRKRRIRLIQDYCN